jgi:catechol 2,3-dioxygenase-like lactoylglutathione lyase family enzyme
MTKTIGLGHIMITVSDLQKSKDFYTKGCSLKIIAEQGKTIGLTDGKSSIWLSTSRDYKPKELKFDRNQIGLDHFAFNVAKIDELKEIEKNLKSLGSEMEEGGISDDGGPTIFVKDPDGIKVEFRLKK